MSGPAPSPRSQPAEAWLRDLVPMRLQGPIEIIDRATQVLRTRLADFLVVSLGVNVPIWLILAIVLRNDWARGLDNNVQWFWSSVVPEPFLFATSGTGAHGSTLTFLLGRGLPSLGLAFTGAATGVLVASWASGRAMTGAQALAVVARKAHQLVALWLAVHVLEAVTVVGLVVGPLVFGIAAPLWGMQPASVRRTIGRSWQLSMAQFGRTLVVVAAATLLSLFIGALLGGAPMLILTAITSQWSNLGGTAAVSLSGVLPHLVMDPLLALSMALLALDLRVRVEGADLEAELQELQRAAT